MLQAVSARSAICRDPAVRRRQLRTHTTETLVNLMPLQTELLSLAERFCVCSTARCCIVAAQGECWCSVRRCAIGQPAAALIHYCERSKHLLHDVAQDATR